MLLWMSVGSARCNREREDCDVANPLTSRVLLGQKRIRATSRFDLGNALVVDLLSGTLESVTELTLFGGANAIAIESAPGVWEMAAAFSSAALAPPDRRRSRGIPAKR